MKVLLANDAQPDALNNDGKAALHDACFMGDLNAINILINAGADFDIKVRIFKSLFSYAMVLMLRLNKWQLRETKVLRAFIELLQDTLM